MGKQVLKETHTSDGHRKGKGHERERKLLQGDVLGMQEGESGGWPRGGRGAWEAKVCFPGEKQRGPPRRPEE